MIIFTISGNILYLMKEVLRTENLSKHYGDVKAVSDLTLNIDQGEIYGFLGLNGAGKTTTIRMLLGMIRPTAGLAFIHNTKIKPGETTLWEKIGYLVESPSFYPELTVKENLQITSKLRMLKDSNSVNRVIQRLQLEKYTERKAKNLSQGNKQRLGLAKALIHDPDILLLDEPSNALDPEGIVEIRELLHDLAYNHGVTVLVSSHILGEVSKFANRIGIIDDGKLLLEINAHELDEMCRKWLLVDAKDQKAVVNILHDQGLEAKRNGDGYLKMTGKNVVENPEMIASLLVEKGHPPSLIKVEKEDLESFFLRTINKHPN